MNFGHKITIVIITFVCFIIGIVTFTMMQDDIQLVSKNYYEKEILYQQEIDKMKNTQAYYGRVARYEIDQQQLSFNFWSARLEGLPEGSIHLFRPSDARKDLRLYIKTNAQMKQLISIAALDKGLWKAKVEWTHQGEAFYEEQSFVIQ